MPRWRNLLVRSALLPGATAVYLSACSGAEFQTGAAAGGSANAGTGASPSAGESPGGNPGETGGSDNQAGADTTNAGSGAGGSGSGGVTGGGSAGTAGNAGNGGMGGGGGAAACVCPAGQYCRDGTGGCTDCAAVNRLNFAAPERLDSVSPEAGSRFPRRGNTKTDLFFRVEGAGLSYSADYEASPGSSVQGTAAQDSGPLLLGADAAALPGSMLGFNFVFDRAVGARRRLFVGKWANSALGMHEAAPAPYNSPTKNDYSPALTDANASGSARLYWMTDRGAAPALATQLLGAAAAPGLVSVELGQADCKADDTDFTPWVTSDGKLLLLSATRKDDNCAAAGQGKDIYTALLQTSNGLPSAPARPMNDINSAMDDVDPSFSADMCELYFASNRGGQFAIYRAKRR